MPEVVADTSPLQYLFQLGLLDLLPTFCEQVIVPEAVVKEVSAGRARGVALPELEALSWVCVRKARSSAVLPLIPDLGAGEREVLAMAIELSQPLVILDDALGRRFAMRLEIPLTGTLGVLLKAKRSGRLDRLGRSSSSSTPSISGSTRRRGRVS